MMVMISGVDHGAMVQRRSARAMEDRCNAERQDIVNSGQALLKKLVEEMLALVDRRGFDLMVHARSFDVSIAGQAIAFDCELATVEQRFEQLAAAIEARIAYDRAQAMLEAAADIGPLPLWLVSGSDVLAKWLQWANVATPLRNAIALTHEVGNAPVSGLLDRRARHELGRGAARIRVSGGLAVAERIELPGRLRCTAALGRKARIRIEGNPLPETIMSALSDDPRRNDQRRVADLVDHPFVAMADLRLAGIRNDGNAVVIDIASRCEPLAPLPKAARNAVPRSADPGCPWRPTRQEITTLYELVERGRQLAGLST